jgi:hypothetical protein
LSLIVNHIRLFANVFQIHEESVTRADKRECLVWTGIPAVFAIGRSRADGAFGITIMDEAEFGDVWSSYFPRPLDQIKKYANRTSTSFFRYSKLNRLTSLRLEFRRRSYNSGDLLGVAKSHRSVDSSSFARSAPYEVYIHQ